MLLPDLSCPLHCVATTATGHPFTHTRSGSVRSPIRQAIRVFGNMNILFSNVCTHTYPIRVLSGPSEISPTKKFLLVTDFFLIFRPSSVDFWRNDIGSDICMNMTWYINVYVVSWNFSECWKSELTQIGYVWNDLYTLEPIPIRQSDSTVVGRKTNKFIWSLN